MAAHTAGRSGRCFAVGLAALCFAAFAGACSGEKATGQKEGQEATLPADGEFRVYEEWPFDAEEARRRQEETARALGLPVEKDVDLGDGVRMAMVLIPAGEFMMGGEHSPEDAARRYEGEADWFRDEQPRHRVRIAQPFYLGKYEVPQGEWQQVMGSNPSRYKGNDRRPVESVSWHGCQEFLKKLNAEGRGLYRLPTEEEWEYACRAGTATAFSFGDAPGRLGDYAWTRFNSGGTTNPVGLKQPNAWGLHDMHGNVWEWCQSLYKPYPYRSDDGRESLDAGGGRVLRGGSWNLDNPGLFRCAYRGYLGLDPEYRDDRRGFRVAKTLTP